ncbi:MAG: hypothetical protein H0X72_14580 [Acidobacteria bacterium]|jgi:hypothetical protein|nr:hypothetical protein [Acidobacteriota bacterium]
MKNKSLLFILWLIAGFLPIGNGLQYFIAGEAYRNTDLRNYAVVGQIIFGLATIGYAFWSKRKTLQSE